MSLSGSGSVEYKNPNYGTKTWEGDWGIREYVYSLDWGERTHQIPSSDWETGEGGRWKRYFELDLSGFQIRLGISIRFKNIE